MNKSQLVQEVAKATGKSVTETTALVEAVFAGIKKGISEDGETKVLGFGSFKSSVRSARTGRNPQTGQPLDIPEKTVVKFKSFL
jgi:DNA-binding protein HU-beta